MTSGAIQNGVPITVFLFAIVSWTVRLFSSFLFHSKTHSELSSHSEVCEFRYSIGVEQNVTSLEANDYYFLSF